MSNVLLLLNCFSSGGGGVTKKLGPARVLFCSSTACSACSTNCRIAFLTLLARLMRASRRTNADWNTVTLPSLLRYKQTFCKPSCGCSSSNFSVCHAYYQSLCIKNSYQLNGLQLNLIPWLSINLSLTVVAEPDDSILLIPKPATKHVHEPVPSISCFIFLKPIIILHSHLLYSV